MMTMPLSEAARVLDGHCRDGDVMFRGVSTDSRRLESGQLFFALVGPRFDGHEFLADAADRGAAGAVVSRTNSETLSCVRVPNTLRALGELAAVARKKACSAIVLSGALEPSAQVLSRSLSTPETPRLPCSRRLHRGMLLTGRSLRSEWPVIVCAP